jgi:hypothetical protein
LGAGGNLRKAKRATCSELAVWFLWSLGARCAGKFRRQGQWTASWTPLYTLFWRAILVARVVAFELELPREVRRYR